ncbi:hypothetical protein RFI_06803 [Reticulomyxa filosa]|uniref:Centrosomal protein of 70 kDa n=1 Tax=Reticulomyxa filosa TaxID=46433 RepID=X6NWG1_RETFI|nr:hypothetical protein RFI_06803 [Reticulomyxa filosa]|eukprot:ETO30316.1 hypothetical protein RFI_06803 [Reticulomyxa filosa]
MNQIYVELNENRNFLTSVRDILGMPKSTPVNGCLRVLQEVVDSKGTPKNCGGSKLTTLQLNHVFNSELKDNSSDLLIKWNNWIMEVCELLNCDENDMTATVRTIKEKCSEYELIFPKIDSLIDQIRKILGIEHAHQILPKLKELCLQNETTMHEE